MLYLQERRVSSRQTAWEGSRGVPTVAIADAQPGAMLSQPVYSPRGILLAPDGAVLTEAHLAIFASWGVQSISIAGEAPAATSSTRQLTAEQQEAIHDLVEDRFSLVVPMFPFMREVRRVTEEILVKRLQAQLTTEGRTDDGSHGA